MRVLCIDAKPGYITGNIPPFKEGDICDAVQDDEYEDSYVINGDTSKCWLKLRFVPTSSIDETKMIREHQKQLA